MTGLLPSFVQFAPSRYWQFLQALRRKTAKNNFQIINALRGMRVGHDVGLGALLLGLLTHSLQIEAAVFA